MSGGQLASDGRCTAVARVATVGALALLLAACASRPPPPDWQMNARSAAEGLLQAYLSGNARVEAQELARLRGEIASTGRPDLLARAELMRCAAQVASVDFDDCPAYRPLAADAAAPERAYADYLAGRAQAAQVELLPEAQRAIARSPGGPADAAALQQIEDPLSRLVAAGVLLRSGRAHPSIYGVAADTASSQGWRRPLLAWLKLQQQRAQQVGDDAESERLKRRIALVQDTPPR